MFQDNNKKLSPFFFIKPTRPDACKLRSGSLSFRIIDTPTTPYATRGKVRSPNPAPDYTCTCCCPGSIWSSKIQNQRNTKQKIGKGENPTQATCTRKPQRDDVSSATRCTCCFHVVAAAAAVAVYAHTVRSCFYSPADRVSQRWRKRESKADDPTRGFGLLRKVVRPSSTVGGSVTSR